MSPPASAIVCSHNPRRDHLERTLASLRAQTLAKDQWELGLVDNASEQPLSSEVDLTWHPLARHIREEELGLTSARLRAIRESRGDLLIFVDDDNILSADYLETALNIAARKPHIGAFGGSIKGEFEAPLPEWINPYLEGLAVSEIHQDYWSNLPTWSRAVPYGAGLCVRRSIAEDYTRKVLVNLKRKQLGRIGDEMGAGEDTDLAWCSIDLGMGTGRFCALQLTHLIPTGRLTKDYITRLNAGFASSGVVLDSFRDAPTARRSTGCAGLMRLVWNLMSSSAIERKILLATRKARADTHKRLHTSAEKSSRTETKASGIGPC